MIDHSRISANTFDSLADSYQAKFMNLSEYDDTYQLFCDLLRPGPARVLDAACGPGNVSRYLMAHRPELDLLGIDLAPRMVELARLAVPAGRFLVHDCRRLAELEGRFDGILCAFGLPYISPAEADALIRSAARVLDPGGLLYLSTMLSDSDDAGFHSASNGEQVYMYSHRESQLIQSLAQQGFELAMQRHLASPAAASQVTTDLILIAKKTS